MAAELQSDGAIVYHLHLGDQATRMNDHIGRVVRLEYEGAIHCIHCGRKTKKSFSQGYCFPCMKSLAQCDQCVLSPERCHYSAGTCREPEWGEQFCMTDHIVYLANTTAPKVGLTRLNQIPTRWIDQGAEQALPIMRVATRQQAGFIEDVLRSKVSDKTNWRNMLKGTAESIDLSALRDQLLNECADELEAVKTRFGSENFEVLQTPVVTLRFPVDSYPTKIASFNLDKDPVAEGVLMGIKGQYLILDSGVINLRKYTGYQLGFVVQ
nr:DUF2797 domain-containing protein [Halioxenophilus sp. WMMB6]